MKRLIAEWTWRIAVLAALVSIAYDLRGLRDDLNQPADDTQAVASAQDDMQDSLAAIHDEITALTQKVNAVLIVMARSK